MTSLAIFPCTVCSCPILSVTWQVETSYVGVDRWGIRTWHTGFADSILCCSPMNSRLIQGGLDFARKKEEVDFTARGFRGFWMFFVQGPSSASCISESSKTVAIFPRDLNEFLRSDSDQIPNSIKQMSEIARSYEFYESVTGVTQATTVGILCEIVRLAQVLVVEAVGRISFADRVLDKIFSPARSGFDSVVLGSFARSPVMAFYSDQTGGTESELDTIPTWVNFLCNDKVKATDRGLHYMVLWSPWWQYIWRGPWTSTLTTRSSQGWPNRSMKQRREACLYQSVTTPWQHSSGYLITSWRVQTKRARNLQGRGSPYMAIEEPLWGKDSCADKMITEELGGLPKSRPNWPSQEIGS